MKLALLCALLGGCAVAQSLPSLRYCDTVDYKRHGRDIDIIAHCFEAVESAIPLPLPGKP